MTSQSTEAFATAATVADFLALPPVFFEFFEVVEA
jgi:hypothetical protein